MRSTYNFYNNKDEVEDEPEDVPEFNDETFIIYPATSGIGIEISKDDIIFGNKITITPEIKVYPINDMVRITKSGETKRYWLTKDNIKTILNMEVD